MQLDLIGQLDGGDPLRGFHLVRHLHQRAATRRTLPIVGRKLVPNLHDRQRRLWTRTMTGRRRARRRCRRSPRRTRVVVVKHLCPPLLEFLQDGELQLLRISHAAESGDFRREFQRLRDEALIFAIEEETDLAKRFKVVFLGELHHSQSFDHES